MSCVIEGIKGFCANVDDSLERLASNTSIERNSHNTLYAQSYYVQDKSKPLFHLTSDSFSLSLPTSYSPSSAYFKDTSLKSCESIGAGWRASFYQVTIGKSTAQLPFLQGLFCLVSGVSKVVGQVFDLLCNTTILGAKDFLCQRTCTKLSEIPAKIGRLIKTVLKTIAHTFRLIPFLGGFIAKFLVVIIDKVSEMISKTLDYISNNISCNSERNRKQHGEQFMLHTDYESESSTESYTPIFSDFATTPLKLEGRNRLDRIGGETLHHWDPPRDAPVRSLYEDDPYAHSAI